jgi:transposase
MEAVTTQKTVQTAEQADTLRRERGLAMAKSQTVSYRKPGLHLVKSASHGGTYIVESDEQTGEETCTCLDWETRRLPCKHIFAVEYAHRIAVEPDGAVTVEQTVKIKYRQDWPAYDAAQSREKECAAKLLRGLCDMVEEAPQTNGRPRLPLSDRAFAVTGKVYTGMSTRRANTDMQAWATAGMMTRTPSWSSVSDYMEDPALTPVLHRLIEASATPLASVESQFAVDSSGFTTSVYRRWFDAKYKREMAEATWIKAHVMVGTKTNIVTAVRITDGNSGDSPEFAPLVANTAERFGIADVSADKAYLSRENMAAVDKVGGTPVIAFKRNSVANGEGATELWTKMFHWFSFNRTEYLARYHRRSNVETTFSMVKRKFGGNLRCKTFTAQTNELLAKFLCHNLAVLVHEMFELGIVPMFWPEAPVCVAGREPPTSVGKVLYLSEKSGNP